MLLETLLIFALIPSGTKFLTFGDFLSFAVSNFCD